MIDIVIAGLVLFGAIRGFMKGFIFEIAILGSMIVCYLMGFKVAGIASGWLSSVTSISGENLRYGSLLVSWLAISVGIFFLAKLFEGLVKIAALGIFNKIAGALFGAFKYVFILSLFFYFFNRINLPVRWINIDQKAESRFYYPVMKIAPAILKLHE